MYFQTNLAIELLVRAECTYNADDVLDALMLRFSVYISRVTRWLTTVEPDVEPETESEGKL